MCILFHDTTAPSWLGSPHYRGFTITDRHNTLSRTPLNECSDRRRDIYLSTHYSQQTCVRAPDEIRTRNPSKRAAADPRLRIRDHWDRPSSIYTLDRLVNPLNMKRRLPSSLYTLHRLVNPLNKKRRLPSSLYTLERLVNPLNTKRRLPSSVYTLDRLVNALNTKSRLFI